MRNDFSGRIILLGKIFIFVPDNNLTFTKKRAMKINITRKTKELEQEVFFNLFDEFIHNSSAGIRRKKDGSRLSEGTVGNYVSVKNSIQKFCDKKNFRIRLFIDCNLTQKEREKAFKYWLKFYDRYTSYLYYDTCFPQCSTLKIFLDNLV